MLHFAENLLKAEPGIAHLFSVGQAGFILKSASGQVLGVDLYLSDCVEREEGHLGFKRMLPHILEAGEITFDALIATHAHRDHFDVDAMPNLMNANKTLLFAAEDCKDDTEALGMPSDRIFFVRPGMEKRCGDFTLDFVSCDHGTESPEAVGVIITVDNKRILEVGDTCLRLDRVNEYLHFGPIDVLIAPINGAYGNMNEADCVTLARALQPGLTIPCHYGMFASHGGNPGRFHELMSEKHLPYTILTQGEEYPLS